MTKEELIDEAIEHGLVRAGTAEEAEKEFTCHPCPEKDSCPCAWDLYNVDGCCLMGK